MIIDSLFLYLVFARHEVPKQSNGYPVSLRLLRRKAPRNDNKEYNSLSVTDNTAILNTPLDEGEKSCELRDHYRAGGSRPATN